MNEREIWVVCDRQKDCLHIKQMLAKAAELGREKGFSVSVVCIGSHTESELWEFLKYGANRAIVCSVEAELSELEFFDVLVKIVCHFNQPALIMFPSSVFLRPVAAYMSAHFESGLTADCINIEADDYGGFIFSRAALNSSVIAKVVCVNTEMAMCTVKNNVFIESAISELCNIRIEKFHYNENSMVKRPKIEVISREVNNEKSKSIGISEAKRIFAFGRGSARDENLALLRRNADKYGALIVGTRAVVEDQLIEKSFQVGQSGISVAPEVYVCFGVSGATQHIVGIANSQIIVSVNNDPDAPIFEYSDYAVVDDAEIILKELVKIKN